MLNIVEAIQQQLNYPPLDKVDPNTQKEKHTGAYKVTSLHQAIIPSVLIAMFKYSRTDAGAASIAGANISTPWLNSIFGDALPKVVSRISDHTNISMMEVEYAMENVALTAVHIIGNNVKDAAAVKSFFTAQRDTILLFLPANLQIGEMLHDTTIDDRTNKMEGPISSLMHSIEKKFSGTD
jgi:hypothetical protein